jgi:ribonuclease VapC
MIVDSSALLAIMLFEPEADACMEAIVTAPSRAMSVANWLETTMVMDRRTDPATVARFEDFVRDARIELMPVSVTQAEIARRAWRLFGRGRHPARLNYGDCFAYALAKETGQPLLFKGADFAHTDIQPALKD